ncbi:aldehyde dehydrogenase 1-like [Coccinella septempunctata]|uniref:aldehyde dehydrogenase 1-like n=1 Tax=Coccinella septempunctata TaxID=41139 RepID=UPI001D06E7ED|nr:aldehyde dehydrogenase 1-like [Coccinella septempunctata]
MSFKKINCELIKDVFESMKYVEKKEDFRGAMGEFLKHQTTEELKVLLSSISKNDKWSELSNENRSDLLDKFATEIEKAIDSFAELERRIKKVETVFLKEKSLPYLVKTLRYYANLCQLVKVGQKGLVVCKLSDNSCISLLGYTLGPALATGFKVLFVSSPKMGCFIEFIVSLALRVGFPKETISVISEDNNLDVVLKHATVVHCFDNVDDKFQSERMLGIVPLLMPIIIFDSSDLDSACDSVINSTWKDQLVFTSLAKEIFVQETIYEVFIKKLKDKINFSTSKLGNNNFSETLQNLLLDAEKNGVETYTSHYGHVLFLGGRVISKDSSAAPCASVSAFRNIDEAIALANNNVQGFSASVWTENIGIANYVAQKLDVCNVWINSFGIYSPDVTFTPRKLSGKGYFGGLQGFHDLLFYNKDIMGFTGSKVSYEEKDILKSITSAKNAQPKWKSIEKSVKIKQFSALIKFIENNKNKFKNDEISEEWFREWKTFFYQYIDSNQNPSILSPYKEYNLNISYSPKGVLVAEFTKYISNHNKRLLIASILQGNCLVVLNQYDKLQGFYNELSEQLPTGVLKVLPYSYGASGAAVKNPMVDCYFNEYKIDEKLGLCDKFMSVSNCWSDVNNKVSYVKNVWSNIGQGYLV